jgi:hypothetical protein
VAITKPKRISDIKPIFNLAQTSQYQVIFGGLSDDLRKYLRDRNVDYRFVTEDAGLMCYSASLPTSSFATADLKGSYTGVMEKFAHTKMFNPIDLSFYVDNKYKMVKFLEHWTEYIASGSTDPANVTLNPTTPGYFYRMQYPTDYKCDATKIVKFNRDYSNPIEYNFYGLFPMAVSSPSVSYEGSSTLTISATFNYDRYVCGKVYSADINRNSDNNKDETQPSNRSTNTNTNYSSTFGPNSKVTFAYNPNTTNFSI